MIEVIFPSRDILKVRLLSQRVPHSRFLKPLNRSRRSILKRHYHRLPFFVWALRREYLPNEVAKTTGLRPHLTRGG